MWKVRLLKERIYSVVLVMVQKGVVLHNQRVKKEGRYNRNKNNCWHISKKTELVMANIHLYYILGEIKSFDLFICTM